MKYIKFFSELKLDDIPLAGGKGASLGEMTQAGLPVPAGFCLTTEAYRAFVTANGLQKQIFTHAAQTERNEQLIRTLFSNATMPEPILAELTTAYGRLRSTSVAVRSSATAEDLPGASFAGQQDTYLNIRGIGAVETAVKNCWGSLWTDRAIVYRQREQITPDEVSMAVVIQELIPSDSAGVLFTANPVTGARDETVINAAWGLGEAVVSGLVTPDNIVVNKTTGQIKSQQISDKQVMTVRTVNGSKEQPVPEQKRTIPVLSNEQIHKLVALGQAVEKHAQRPMDLEWGIANGQLHLLQARPITALPEPPEAVDLMDMEWSRKILIERYPDPVTPFTWSISSQLLFSSFASSIGLIGGKLSKDGPPLMRLIYGHAYMNVTLLNQEFASSPARPPIEPEGESEAAPRPRPSLKELPKLLAMLARLSNLLRTTHHKWDRLQGPFETAVRHSATHDWETASTADLLNQLIHQQEIMAPLMDNHAYSIVAAELSLQLLQAITRAWLGDESQHLATSMLSGLTGNKTVETNRALWRLAVQARPQAQLRQLLEAPLNENWREEMATLPSGAAFLSNLGDFLHAYGHRSPRYEMAHPTWVEQPQQVLEMVRMYLDDSIVDPGDGEARQAAARETAVSLARQRLSFPKRLIFDRVLPLAQIYFRHRENQQFYLAMGLPTLRRVLAVLGKRFQDAGQLQSSDDVYFLENRELHALTAQMAGLPVDADNLPANPIQLVAERRAAMKRYQKMRPPITLGGKGSPSKQSTSANSLNGIAASSGTISGKARIVLGPEDFGKLQPGEILVTPATTPAWTPLFGIAAGLITDYGGLLSHSGVVAREYGLPAVLGTGDATQRIKNGDEITVDGDRGIVML